MVSNDEICQPREKDDSKYVLHKEWLLNSNLHMQVREVKIYSKEKNILVYKQEWRGRMYIGMLGGVKKKTGYDITLLRGL